RRAVNASRHPAPTGAPTAVPPSSLTVASATSRNGGSSLGSSIATTELSVVWPQQECLLHATDVPASATRSSLSHESPHGKGSGRATDLAARVQTATCLQSIAVDPMVNATRAPSAAKEDTGARSRAGRRATTRCVLRSGA